MREIQSTEATTQLSAVLDAVERGETIAIMRQGRRIARLIPEPVGRREEVQRAIDELKLLGKANGKVSLADILSARHEGHRY